MKTIDAYTRKIVRAWRILRRAPRASDAALEGLVGTSYGADEWAFIRRCVYAYRQQGAATRVAAVIYNFAYESEGERQTRLRGYV